MTQTSCVCIIHTYSKATKLHCFGLRISFRSRNTQVI